MKIKKKRRINIRLDMTPMVDIGFLLLIFYMATTQFKPPEKKEVTLPSSHSMIEMPKRNVFLITVPALDSIFIDYVTKRKVTLDDGSIIDRTFRNVKAIPFALAETVGEAVQEMRAEEMRNINDLLPGEDKADDRKKAREDLLRSFVVVKGDRNVEFGVMEKLMDSLRKAQLNSFQIITELEQDQGKAVR